MEKESIIQKKWILTTVGILFLIVFAATFIPALIALNLIEAQKPVFVYFFGINLTLVVGGSLSLIFFLIRKWGICIEHALLMEEKDTGKGHKVEMQKLLNEDAEKRREYDLNRSQINDLFRLIELSKEKPEETIDKTKTKEKGEIPKLIENDKITKKSEVIDSDKLANLIKQYQDLISKQQIQTS